MEAFAAGASALVPVGSQAVSASVVVASSALTASRRCADMVWSPRDIGGAIWCFAGAEAADATRCAVRRTRDAPGCAHRVHYRCTAVRQGVGAPVAGL
ncbi:hypothetical protein GCM10025734_41300 [Kitasatospora paranensis]